MIVSVKHSILISMVALLSQALWSQNYEFSGTVTDSLQPVPYAAIVLKHISNSEIVIGTYSDVSGNFSMTVKQRGKYRVYVSALGFKDFESSSIDVNKDIHYPIKLQPENTQLNEVVVTSKKAVYESKEGKLIFNVQNSSLATGQTAFDMLKNLPGVSIGQNDQILFRGSTGINVMVDGKMTYLSGNQLAIYLKGMSTEDINKIELVTTPSAEFDAAGNTGIINIVPKKNLAQGYAVDLRASISKGKYWMTNENIAASLRTKKLNLFGSFDFNTPHQFTDDSSGNRIVNDGNVVDLRRTNESGYKIKFYTWRFAADWQFHPKHSISANYHGYFDDFESFNNSTARQFDASGNLQSFILSTNDLIEPYHYDAVNVNYLHTIDTLGKRISADAHYTSYRNYSDGLLTTRNFDQDGTFIFENNQRSHQPGFVTIKSVKADTDLPLNAFRLKSGAKYAEVTNDNTFRFDSLQNGDFVEIENLTNQFKYKEKIAALYVSASKQFSKTTIEAGLRMEHTDAKGFTVTDGVTNQWKYTTFFPSLSIEQPFNERHKLDLSISRRINRPSYTDLNPVRWYSDQFFYYSGNPNLVPELAWVHSLTYTLRNKYIISIIYNHSNNYINRRLSFDDNGVTLRTQSANFDHRKRLDLTVSIPYKPFNFWNIQLFSDASYTSYPIAMISGEKDLNLWALTTTLQQDFTLPKNISINLAAYFFSSELRGIYITEPNNYIDFGIKKSFLNNNLLVQCLVRDVFNTTRYQASSQTDVTNYFYDDKPYSRVVSLSVKYHFGGESFKSDNKRTEEQERL